MRQRARVLVVDDEEVVTVGLRAVLGRHAWVDRCLQATDGARALALARRFEPHLAVVGLSVANLSGVELSERLRRTSPSTYVLLMGSADRLPPGTVAAARASGYISRQWSLDDMIAAIRLAAIGMQVGSERSAGVAALLTGREGDVLTHIARGATNREIANELTLSLYTVKQHASAAYRKLDARNRTEAVGHARRLGLIS